MKINIWFKKRNGMIYTVGISVGQPVSVTQYFVSILVDPLFFIFLEIEYE